MLDDLRRRAERDLGHRGRDVALVGHGVDDLRRAFVGAFQIVIGSEFGGRFHQPGEQRGLRQRHVPSVMAEIFARRRLHAIGARTEIDAVEIEFEDLILGIFALQPQRQDRLLEFARQRALLRQEQVFGELLRQRRAALHRAAAGHIPQPRAQNAHGVDAEMGIETSVLDGDERLGQVGGQIGQPDGGAAGVAAVGEQRAVDAQDLDVGRPLGDRQLVDRGKLARIIGERGAQADDAPYAENERPIEQPAQQRTPARTPLGRLFLGFRARRTVVGIGVKPGGGAIEIRLDPPFRVRAAPSEHCSRAPRPPLRRHRVLTRRD